MFPNNVSKFNQSLIHKGGCGWFSKHDKSIKVDSGDGSARTLEACTSVSFVLYLLTINKRYRLKVRVKRKLHMVVVTEIFVLLTAWRRQASHCSSCLSNESRNKVNNRVSTNSKFNTVKFSYILCMKLSMATFISLEVQWCSSLHIRQVSSWTKGWKIGGLVVLFTCGLFSIIISVVSLDKKLCFILPPFTQLCKGALGTYCNSNPAIGQGVGVGGGSNTSTCSC